MAYVLGSRSMANLIGVHPQLVAVVRRAIRITEQDFAVHDGLRSLAEQREFVRRGVSRTMRSKHLAQEDGCGHAVDLVPYIGSQLRWEWEPIYRIAAAVRAAAEPEAAGLRWGGVWDRRLHELGTTAEQMRSAVAAYTRRHPGPDFIDAPHFELVE